VRPSSYVTIKNGTSIGHGLFAIKWISEGSIITMFIGEKIDMETWEKRRHEGLGGYGVQINSNEILDCRQSFGKGECVASAANSYKNICNKVTLKTGRCNAKLVIRNRIALLISTCDIMEETEILFDYGTAYRHFISIEQQPNLCS